MDFRDGGSHFTVFNGWTFANMEAIGITTRDATTASSAAKAMTTSIVGGFGYPWSTAR